MTKKIKVKKFPYVREFKGKKHLKRARKYAFKLAVYGYDFRVLTFPKEHATIVIKLKKSKKIKKRAKRILMGLRD